MINQKKMKQQIDIMVYKVYMYEILDGSYKNKKVYIDNYLSTTHNVRLKNGETFIACIDVIPYLIIL